jgi:hypothetical protein
MPLASLESSIHDSKSLGGAGDYVSDYETGEANAAACQQFSFGILGW